MAETPNLITDLALILTIAGIVTLLFKKLKQPLVLGYLVAGFLVSPHMPYTISIMDKSSIQTWADIGVIFLLFSLGLDFSFKKILKMGMAPIIATCTIIFCMMTLGILVGHAFGWAKMDCIFLGGMLAMASTTIIYKAFNDLDLIQQNFAGLVMSVLILEDILAIVMMVMLSTIARGNNPDGGQLLESILRIAFFLILWFIVGLFVIPLFLRRTRHFMNDETLIVVSLGLCFLMAVISSKVGFSSAFGAFVMGSILAETIEAEKIIRLVAPVKNLFGAVFFVSVGMLVDPKIIAGYGIPILILVITVIVGEALFGTVGFMLSGQPLKTAMKCSFSMTQIGEFAFIIASLGLSLHVISNFLYPVVVAVSIITTFLTPYMIRFSNPCYQYLERHLPKRWIRRLNHITLSARSTSKTERNSWKRLLRSLLRITIICSILSIAGIFLMFTFILPVLRHIFGHLPGNIACGILTVLIISPALRAMVTKKNHSKEVKTLLTEKRINRLPIFFTILVRFIIASGFVFYICNYLTRFNTALLITIALAIIILMIASKRLKKQSIKLERLFIQNLNSREIRAQVQGKRKPLYEGHLLDRNIHISAFEIVEDSKWGGKSLRELQLRKRFGIQVSSILRGHQRINIPNGDNAVYPGDRLEVIGNDKQLTHMTQALKRERVPEDPDIEEREMKLRQFIVTDNCPLIGKNLKESGIRDIYNCMVIGLDEGLENLKIINPERKFQKGDILWVVGEEVALRRLIGEN
ncbi:MAG: cation:proton antiporter [Prevotella sp.]|jgi:CPA2 family monovalent cation:H+ antiporter-2|nr:cation:proton antiporter [Prevotella sp.]MCH4241492.1 cation:proton antiporter [Prevotella sp.]